MILVLANEGQMCNQLLTLASAYSLGLEYQDSVKCPIMNIKLKNSFNFTNNCQAISIEMKESLIWKLIAKYLKFARKMFHFNASEKYEVDKMGKLQIFTDWISFKDDVVFAKHQKEIRNFFSFRDEIKEKCQKIMLDIKVDDKYLVGVHIRRGDYKTFNNGCWYYSDEDYLRWMNNLSVCKKVRFVLFSNEKIDINYFADSGLDITSISGNAVEDLCCLSMCDFIMGPPSTYSWWAAMYGNRKRLILEDKNKMYSWDDFMYLNDRVQAGIDKY